MKFNLLTNIILYEHAFRTLPGDRTGPAPRHTLRSYPNGVIKQRAIINGNYQRYVT